MQLSASAHAANAGLACGQHDRRWDAAETLQLVDGEVTVVEFDRTETIFTNPKDSRSEDYVTGRFG